MTDELSNHYDKEPVLPDNFFEWSLNEKLGYNKKYLLWLTKRLTLGNFKDFTHRDNLNKLKTKLEHSLIDLESKGAKDTQYTNQIV